MKRPGLLLTFAALALLLVLPFLFQRREGPLPGAPDRVVIITPHMESIRAEFARGFREWYAGRTGRRVYVDYRTIGGTSEIARFLNAEYTNAFQRHWEKVEGREWSLLVQQAFDNPRIDPDATPSDDTLAEAARRAFLDSGVSCGVDLFFGGGAYDHSVQAARGNLVDAGLLERHPDWFQTEAVPGSLPDAIPQKLAGETYYDVRGRWYGAVLACYGIIYNRDVLARLGIGEEPRQWVDLTDPRYFRQLGLADPTKSGSMTQAFEMILQQAMAERVLETGSADNKALAEGWMAGMRRIQRICANARYFSDSAQKPNIDVASGDCAAGMSIDFYGRFQQENILTRSGSARFGFHVPEGGTTLSADPIGLLRGAPNRETAIAFMEYVLSLEGQKLWNFRVGAPGGPERYALRRPPIRPELYEEPWNADRSDPGFNPYRASASFTYRGEWTGFLFSEIRTIIRIAFMDARKELVEAWEAILEARAAGRSEDAARAEAVFGDLDRISYSEAATTIDAALKGPPIEEVRLARQLTSHFRTQFQRARDLARGAGAP